MTPEEVLELSIANVTRARNQIDDVEWSAEDGTRSEMDYLCRIVEAVIKAGATTVNIPDTVGYTVPEEYTHFMRKAMEPVYKDVAGRVGQSLIDEFVKETRGATN